MCRTRDRAAFTLVELLVVIGIIAILAAMLLPALTAARTRAQETSTRSLIQQAEIAAQSFFNDYGDYPPSTWEEAARMFDIDLGLVGDADEFNEGIEVFLACVTTRLGGPYLEPADPELGNTDEDFNQALLEGTNSYYAHTGELFELVDYWENPLVYIHNREYYDTDGRYTDGEGESHPLPDNHSLHPDDDDSQYVRYVSADEEELRLYSRSHVEFRAGRPPNLNSFQLFSLGSRGVRNLQGGNGYYYLEPGEWRARRRILTNWEE